MEIYIYIYTWCLIKLAKAIEEIKSTKFINCIYSIKFLPSQVMRRRVQDAFEGVGDTDGGKEVHSLRQLIEDIN